MRTLILLVITLCIVAGCSKSGNEAEAAAKQRSNDFLATIEQHKFKLVAFYSDKPIDYITDDTEVRSETDLWRYVKYHIYDDENYFAPAGKLTIYQKADKFPGNDNEELNANYGVSAKGADVVFDFVDYIYVKTEYKLQEFNNTYFIVYITGPAGSKLYSKFSRIQ